MCDSIIFDLDGTLWDATDGAAAVWAEEAKKLGAVADTVTADKLKALYGLPLEEIAVRLLPSASQETAIAVMRESVIKQCPHLEKDGGILYPGLIETLTELKKKYKLFIVSNCEEGYIQCFLNAHKLWDIFTDFEYPGRSGQLKAENIKSVVIRNGLENPVYVGDTAGDFAAATKAGVPFIYAKYGFGEVKDYERAIESFPELLNL